MALKGKLIKITSGAGNGSSTVGINGRHRALPHNQVVAVSEAELEVLRNSRTTFTEEGDAKASQLEGAVDAPGEQDTDEGLNTDATGTPAGADHLETKPPSESAMVAVRTSPPEDPTPAGADHLTPTTTPTAEDEAKAREEALEARDAAIEGTTEPAVVLTNADPNQTGQSQPFSADEVLGGNVSDVRESLDGRSEDELRQLLKAEKAGKNRTTLVSAIEAKLA